MILETADWIIIALYLLFTVVIGVIFTKKAGKGLESFFLGGRNLPWYLAGLSMVATTFAADTPLAVTEIVAKDGIAGNWLWWNFVMGGMLTTFFFARLWRRSGVVTEVELIELRYGGKPAAILRGFKAVYLGLFMNILIIGWVNKAFMKILEVFFEIGPQDQLLYTGLAMLIVAGYSSMSGLLGVVFTDALQFIIAMTGCIILAFMVLHSDKVGGVEGLKAALPEGSLNFFPSFDGAGANTLAIGFGSFFAYIGVMWWSSWYPGTEPGGGGYIAQRMMSTKNEKHAIYSTLFFQLAHYCLRPWPWIITGLCAIVIYPEMAQTDPAKTYVMAMRDYLPTGLRGLLLVAFLAAYMSTISTQLNWGASYLINDLFFKRRKEEEGKKQVLYSRIITVVLMVLALGVTTRIDSIKAVWEFILECGAGLGLVLVLRWYWWRINAWSEITATLVPFIIYAILFITRNYSVELFSQAFPHLSADVIKQMVITTHPYLYFPGSFFITVGMTTLAWLVATKLTKPEPQEVLLKFYDKVRPGGAWSPVEGLVEDNVFKPSLWTLAGCWLTAVLFTYGFLFFSGKLILGFYKEALIYGTIDVVLLLILISLVKKSRIMN